MSNPHDEKYTGLKKRIEAALAGGGKARIEAQYKKGKKTARERLDLLLDDDSFIETDQLVVHRTNTFGLEKQKPGLMNW